MKRKTLEQYFSGEEQWREFARLFEAEWARCDFKDELLSAVGGDREIAMVVYGSVLYRPLEWVDKSIPALSGSTPRECSKTEDGRKRLKEMLMRLPR